MNIRLDRAIALCLTLGLLHAGTARGQEPAPDLAAVAKRLADLEKKVADQGTQLAALQTALKEETTARQAAEKALAAETVGREKGDVAAMAHADQKVAAEAAARQSALQPLTEKLAPLSRAGNDLVLSGVNLRIVNGMGQTATTNGLGNLLLGYNESRGTFVPADDRTGSHNLVVGRMNNYLSYGGLVAGHFNEIAGPFATVTGGTVNTASGEAASVSGGSGRLVKDARAWAGGPEG